MEEDRVILLKENPMSGMLPTLGEQIDSEEWRLLGCYAVWLL
jgi:hypothetical protein